MSHGAQSETSRKIERLWPRLAIPHNLAYRFVNDEVFCWLLGPNIQNRYAIVGGVGTDIFSAVEKRTMLADLVSKVTSRYRVEPQVLVKDLFEFVSAALEAGMLSNGRPHDQVSHPTDPRAPSSGTPEPSPEDVLDAMYARASAKAHPLKVFLELTYQCNHRCQHCYLGLGTDASAKGQPLPTSRLLELLEELAQEGVLELVLTGGEPTMHQDFTRILRRAAELRFAVTILTNGTLLDEELIESLASIPLQIRIPIYGLEEYHNRFVRNAHSFQSIWKAIEVLAARGADVLPASLLMKDNGEDLVELKRHCDALGLPFLVTPLLYPTVFQVGAPTHFRASNEDLRAIMPKLDVHLRQHRCTTGLSRFRITPDGSLDACEMLPVTFGNLRNESFKNVLCSPARQEWIARFPLLLKHREQACKTCSAQQYCIDCIGLAYLETSSYTSHSQESCRLAQLAAYVEAHSVRMTQLA